MLIQLNLLDEHTKEKLPGPGVFNTDHIISIGETGPDSNIYVIELTSQRAVYIDKEGYDKLMQCLGV